MFARNYWPQNYWPENEWPDFAAEVPAIGGYISGVGGGGVTKLGDFLTLDVDFSYGMSMRTGASTIPQGTPVPPVTGWDVVIQFSAGPTYDVVMPTGNSMGTFVSTIGGFTQDCYKSQLNNGMTVFFRPDTTSSRMEIVFEYGLCFNAGGLPVANLGSYTATIRQDNNVIATVAVPKHYWASRWRWQSAVRPFVGNIDALIASGYLPPYNRVAASTDPGTMVDGIYTPPYTPMQTNVIGGTNYACGVLMYMPGTSGRGSIGLLTEAQARYICTGDTAWAGQPALTALQVVRDQAETSGTVMWHFRDENTGAPISFVAHPSASTSGSGSPIIPQTWTATITPDPAHSPNLNWFPYLMTGDPYHLEELQFQATYNYLSRAINFRPWLAQARQWAWDIRTLGQAAAATPVSVPSWLLPKSYWTNLLTSYTNYYTTTYVNGANPPQATFGCTDNIPDSGSGSRSPPGTFSKPWEESYVHCAHAWLYQIGLGTVFLDNVNFAAPNGVNRTSGATAWIRALGAPYNLMYRATSTSPYVTTWADLWNLNVADNIDQSWSYVDSNTIASAGFHNYDYWSATRASLVYANALAVPMGDNLTWLNAQMNLASASSPTAYRWRIGTGLN